MPSCHAAPSRSNVARFVATTLLLFIFSETCTLGVQARIFGAGSLGKNTPRMTQTSNTQANRAISSSSLRLATIARTRGGDLTMHAAGTTEGELDDNDGEKHDITKHPDYQKMQSYRMSQQVLMQLRATILSEELAKRGLPITTIVDVSTPEGAQPPQPVDWDCALSTKEEPKSCLYSFDAEFGTKVMKPIDTDQWITVSALNRLRRMDPSKVEPMWHSKYAILNSWFDPESEFSVLQHVGMQGFVLHFVLQNNRLHLVLGFSLFVMAIICMPMLEYLVNRILVSPLVWGTWHQWARFLHAALPLKLLMGQMLFKGIASLFLYLVSIVKTRLVELECQILEQRIPLTVGPGSEVTQSDSEDEMSDDEEIDEDADDAPDLDIEDDEIDDLDED